MKNLNSDLALFSTMVSKEQPIDKHKVVQLYSKSNYRVVGKHKHSALKPCHWQEQKLLTGRENRNCYKGYFGIESHLCIQNTPALLFCNHQCVFCWRDIENGSFGPKWRGPIDSPKHLAKEMIRHSLNLVFEHISMDKSLQNLELMNKILEEFVKLYDANASYDFDLTESELAEVLNTSRNKIHRAALVLKNTDILLNPHDDLFRMNPEFPHLIHNASEIPPLIEEFVTSKADIQKVFEEAKHPKHAAISLAGEPTLYPRIGELVDEFRKKGMSTFIVTNGTHPEVIRDLWAKNQLPTQLYVTLPAPTRKAYLKISRPLERDLWEKLMETIALLPQLPCRTVVRITSVKYVNINLDMVEDYAAIFKAHTPDFIDIKGFTVEAGALNMQDRFGGEHELREYGPEYSDLLEFAQALEKASGLPIIETHEPSRDILIRGKWPAEKSIKIDYSDLSSL